MSESPVLPTLAHLRSLLTGDQVVTIAGLGDSLTDGWGVSGGFYDKFIRMLKERFPTCRIESVNAGICGDTARGGNARLGRVLERNPHAVMVEFGINDMYSGVPLERYANSTSNSVVQIIEAGALPVLLTSCPIEHLQDRERIAPFYAALAAIEAVLAGD